jgi:hypothetical protein
MNITELLFGVTELPSINESTTTTADAGITTRLPDQPRPFQEFDWSDSVDGPDVSLPVTPTEMPTLDLGDLPPVSPRRHRRANRNSNRHGDPTTTERSARAHDVIAWSSEDTARLDTSSDATVLPFAARQGRAYPRRQAARYILAGLTVASVVAVLTIVVANRPSQEPPATQPAPPPPSPPTVSAVLQSPSAAMRLRFSFTENPFGCDGGSRRLGTLSGAAAGERITFTSATVSGLLSGTADGAGNLGLIWQCKPERGRAVLVGHGDRPGFRSQRHLHGHRSSSTTAPSRADSGCNEERDRRRTNSHLDELHQRRRNRGPDHLCRNDRSDLLQGPGFRRPEREPMVVPHRVVAVE